MSNAEKKNPTCEERIDDHLKSRLEQFAPDFDDAQVCIDIINDYDSGKVEEITKDATDTEEDENGNEVQVVDEDRRLELLQEAARELFQDNVGNNILSVSKKVTYTVLISWGGPSDEFEIDFDEDGDVTGGRYRFKDWFDGAVRELSTEKAQELADTLGIYHEPESRGPRY